MANCRKISASYSGEINVRSELDNDLCTITGMAVLGQNKLVVVDFKNCTLKIVDTVEKGIISRVQLTSGPKDITVLSDNQVAVSLPNLGVIKLFDTKEELLEIGELKVDPNCSGLAYYDGKLLVTYLSSQPGVQIINLQGQLLANVENTQQNKPIFVQPRYAAIDHTGKYFYISDFSLNTVTRADWAGNILGVYKHSSLINPCGLVCLPGGEIIVCSTSNDHLHLISEDFVENKGETILSYVNGFVCQNAMALDEQKNIIYVGKGDSWDLINVVQLGTSSH